MKAVYKEIFTCRKIVASAHQEPNQTEKSARLRDAFEYAGQLCYFPFSFSGKKKAAK
jgi:hypothetical protein